MKISLYFLCRQYFNRVFQCNSRIWTCKLTGTSSLTYLQAVESEREAGKLIASLDECYQRATLRLVHHVRRTNIKTLADELSTFFRDRFVKGEVVDMANSTSSGAKLVNVVVVVVVVISVASLKSKLGCCFLYLPFQDFEAS